jgi:hypothetical protein
VPQQGSADVPASNDGLISYVEQLLPVGREFFGHISTASPGISVGRDYGQSASSQVIGAYRDAVTAAKTQKTAIV